MARLLDGERAPDALQEFSSRNRGSSDRNVKYPAKPVSSSRLLRIEPGADLLSREHKYLLASTFGANPGSAITEAPKTANIANAAKDLTIEAANFSLDPAALGELLNNNPREKAFHPHNLYL